MSFTFSSTSRFITIANADADIKLHYNDIGSGNRVVLMLHGSGPGTNGWINFSGNINSLVQAGFRVILLDFPGWGKSSPVVCHSSRSHFNAQVIKLFLSEIGFNKVHIVGNSMGAHSAVAFALDNPNSVDRIVLMGGGTGYSTLFAPMPTEGIKALQAMYREPTYTNYQKMLELFVFDGKTLGDELIQTRMDAIKESQVHLENFVKSLTKNPKQFPDLSHRLPEIKNKVLIVWGRNDRVMPLEIGLKLLSTITNSRLHIFNQCGHWAQSEHQKEFNQLILDFLI